MSEREIVETDAAPAAIGPYSQAVRAGGLLFCSGQIPIDPLTGELEGDTPAQQTRRCLTNLTAVCEAAGERLASAVRLTIHTTRLSEFDEINKEYARFFDAGAAPARVTVGVSELPRSALVEIDAIVACVGDQK